MSVGGVVTLYQPVPAFARKRALRRGDIVLSPGGIERRVKRVRKEKCEQCGGTGIAEQEVTLTSRYGGKGAKFTTTIHELATGNYTYARPAK